MHRWIVSDPKQPRVRRAADALAVAAGSALILMTGLVADRVLAIEEALVDLTGSLPAWFDQIFQLGYFLGVLLVVGLFIAVVGQGRRHLDLLRDMTLAAILSVGAGVLLVWIAGDAFPAVLPELQSASPEPAFPILRVAIVTGVIAVSGPHLARPIRRFGWLIVLVVAVSGSGLGFGFPGDALGGVGLGMAVAGSILLVFGSPSGYPRIRDVRNGLAELGLSVADLKLSRDQSWGVRRFSGVSDDGQTVEVKAYGQDATDVQLLSKAWRGAWYREDGGGFTVSRFQSVEHEALALVIARDEGIRVPPVLAFGVGGDGVGLIGLGLRGEPLNGGTPTATFVSVWEQLRLLHDAGMAHGGMTLSAVSVDRAEPILHEFDAASFCASEAQQALDIVSLLYEVAIDRGVDDAVGTASEGIGIDRLVAALPYLQAPALTRPQRRATDKPKAVIRQLRQTIAKTAEIDLPEPAKLRRIRWQDLLMPALSLVAFSALLGLLSDIDFGAVWEVLQDATWLLIVIGFAIGQGVFLPQATAMMYATGYSLPLQPLTILQVSVKWIGLAVPSAAGRVTMNSLFLRGFGVPPTIAVTQGAIDGLSGLLVEAGILIVAIIAADIPLDLDTDNLRWGLILLVVMALVTAGILAIWRIERLRKMVLPVLADAWNLLWGVLKDPKRTLLLLTSNLSSRLILAVTMWFILQSIGAPLPLVTSLVATVATNLLAGLVPVPGGIGVAEAVLTSFLVLAGLGADEAFAAAVVFRVATFYIPAGEGFFALRWLQNRGYV